MDPPEGPIIYAMGVLRVQNWGCRLLDPARAPEDSILAKALRMQPGDPCGRKCNAARPQSSLQRKVARCVYIDIYTYVHMHVYENVYINGYLLLRVYMHMYTYV